jgi:hypothetical protein
MTISITLDRMAQQPHNVGQYLGYQVEVDAVNPVGMPSEIFRFIQRPLDPGETNPAAAGTPLAIFQGVCTPNDLLTLPINNPSPPNDLYRSSQLILNYTNIEFGLNDWISIQSDVENLVQSLAAGLVLSSEQTVTFSA